jgi:glycerate-2-kinase
VSGRRADALAIFRAALAALEPGALARRAAERLVPSGARVDLIAVGKAAVAMARGVVEACAPATTLIITKDGHGDGPGVRHAGHPTPDERSLAAGAEVRAAAMAARDVLVLALSGGASALAVAPAWGLSLAEKVAATSAVAAAGADIFALNAVRKHLSLIKGGRLAALTPARAVIALVLSDVVGDDLATIGSGPLTPDPTTFADALAVARAAPGVPARVLALLADPPGPDTPKEPDPRVVVEVLAGPADLVRAAAAAARALGRGGASSERIAVSVEPEPLVGPVDEVAARLAARAAEMALLPGPRVHVAGGEPTLALPARRGRGGRAQHLALAVAARGLPPGAVVLAVGSDGTDGPTADAGGLVDAGTAARVPGGPAAALAAFDSGTALAAAGDLVTTGPTGTNLADLFLVLT